MKKTLYFLLAALMVLLTVSCKKDKKPGNPSVKTQEATEIEAYSARLHARIDFAGVRWASVNFGFFWGTSEETEGTYTMGVGVLDEDNAYSAEITGLAPETEYWFKAFVEIDDQPYTGEILHFTSSIYIVPDSAVDLGIVMTREDGTTYNLYWAKSNLCETGLCANPEDYGDYYAWGETEPYYTEGHSQDNPCSNWRTRTDHPITGYDWVSYTFRTSGDTWDNVKFSKYNTMESYGPVDNITELQRGEKDGETTDDVARAKLGGKWRMPTEAECNALLALKWDKTTQNGKNGCLITAPNGNSIFLPAAGNRDGTILDSAGPSGSYWSSSLYTDKPCLAWSLRFYSSSWSVNSSYRRFGRPIRPVWEE